MNNSQRIKVAQQGDFVTITEGNQNPGASLVWLSWPRKVQRCMSIQE